MVASVILGHPHPESFNHAIAKTIHTTLKEMGIRILYHDLCAEDFDPLLPHREIPQNGTVDPLILKYCEEITQSDGIIVVHPNWWGQPPAILKGWIDRVIRPGVAYAFQENDWGDGVPIGLLKAKIGMVFNTSNTYPDREKEAFGDPLERLWKDCPVIDVDGLA